MALTNLTSTPLLSFPINVHGSFQEIRVKQNFLFPLHFFESMFVGYLQINNTFLNIGETQ